MPIHSVFIRQPDLGQRFRAELAAAANVRVLLHANTIRLDTDASGTQIRQVVVRDCTGRDRQIAARRVVLCAGGIENARLLLLSDQPSPDGTGPNGHHAQRPHANGLGNSYDLVGRFLQDHPCGRAAEIVTANPRRLQDHWNMLYGRRAHYLPKLALSEAAQRRELVLNCVGRLEYEYEPGSGMQAARELFTDLRARRSWGASWPHSAGRRQTSGAANPTLTLIAMALRLAERLRGKLAQQSMAGARPDATAVLARAAGT